MGNAVLILLGLYIVEIFAKKNAATLLNFSIASANINLSGSNFFITLNVIVQNPSNQSFQVDSLSGSLQINNTIIGTISNFKSVLIAQNSQTPYPLTIQIGLIGAGLDIYNLINSGSGDIIAKISGTANVQGIAIPVNVQAKIF